MQHALGALLSPWASVQRVPGRDQHASLTIAFVLTLLCMGVDVPCLLRRDTACRQHLPHGLKHDHLCLRARVGHCGAGRDRMHRCAPI